MDNRTSIINNQKRVGFRNLHGMNRVKKIILGVITMCFILPAARATV
jgi:hypothetical protein